VTAGKQDKNINSLVDYFFRHESGRLTSVLTRVFGPHNLQLAEDVVQDSLLEALNSWTYNGLPENPVAWLYKVARNKAINIVNREKYKREYVSEVAHFLRSEWTADAALETLFSEEGIQDDQLRMMFTCCHPSISPDSQIALILKTLCGFSIPEIARAFVTTEENVNKRLVRARQKIREEKISFSVPAGNELSGRLDSVLKTIYLLFNEGYSASTGNDLVRYDLSAEAIRLAEMIASNDSIRQKSPLQACLALMYLNASRFTARLNEKGEIMTLAEQDRSLWDKSLMQRGYAYLDLATTEGLISPYHLLAAISAYHCAAPDYESTDWRSILSLYDKLLEADSSPLVRLNRAIALAKVEGVDKGIEQLENIRQAGSLRTYHPLYATLGELYMQLHQFQKAIDCLEIAVELSNLAAEKQLLSRKITICRQNV
jgi:RNA polymerase sigma factor (sigma-70 family)